MINCYDRHSAYRCIQYYYGNRTTKRHKIPLMCHINQGLQIMKAFAACELSQRAFCIHPMVQDESVKGLFKDYLIRDAGGAVYEIAENYSRVANAYLARTEHENGVPDSAALQIMLQDKRIKDMLIADKIQNYSSFLQHHLSTHEHAGLLVRYFEWWLEQLGIDEGLFYSWHKSLKE